MSGIWVSRAPIAEHPLRSSRSCLKAIVPCTAKSAPGTIGARIRAFCGEKKAGRFKPPRFLLLLAKLGNLLFHRLSFFLQGFQVALQSRDFLLFGPKSPESKGPKAAAAKP